MGNHLGPSILRGDSLKEKNHDKMIQGISPIISPEELLLLKTSEQVVIIDASSGADAKEKYTSAHLDGALHVDMENQLADIKSVISDGGRHPLPSPEKFSRILTGLGISTRSHVIVYDDKNGSNAAARFWWMLKSVGHKDVQVLDGGFDAALKAGFKISSKKETPATVEKYNAGRWLFPIVNIHEVEKASQNDKYLIIDVRDEERFSGKKEPIDLVAGHIPGAINISFKTNLDFNGFYLSPEILRNKYLKAFQNRKPENIIVHCGSGVTACHTLLAITYAGIDIPNLYVGSWSEWSRKNKPISIK